MSRRWVRMYADILDDPKVAKMAAKTFKFFTFLLVFCAENGIGDKILDTQESICWRFRVSKKAYNIAIKELVALDIISIENNSITIKKWSKRQYKSDDSTERVRRFRNKNETLHETPPEQKQIQKQNTDTETETRSARYTHYENCAKKFCSHYPQKKNEAEAIEEFAAICHNSNFDAQQTDKFLSECLFSIQNQKHEKDCLVKYGYPMPIWKYPDTWLQKKCWKEKVETAKAIKIRAIKEGRYKPTTEELLDNTITEESPDVIPFS